MTQMGRRPTKFEEFDRKTQELIRTVGEIMKFNQYKNIFVCYEKEYVLPKYVCYYALYERGLSSPQIGAKFKRNHATVLNSIRKAKNIPECIVIANIVNARLKSMDERENVLNKYQNGVKIDKIYEKVKSLINSGMDDEEVCKNMDIPTVRTRDIIQFIKMRCKIKKIPDYKNCTIKKIYV